MFISKYEKSKDLFKIKKKKWRKLIRDKMIAKFIEIIKLF